MTLGIDSVVSGRNITITPYIVEGEDVQINSKSLDSVRMAATIKANGVTTIYGNHNGQVTVQSYTEETEEFNPANLTWSASYSTLSSKFTIRILE